MPKKKQQTIEATLGRPKLKAKAPKPRAAKAASSSTSTPNKKTATATPSGEGETGSQSWFYTAKDTRKSPRSRAAPPPPPSSSFMPASSTSKRVTILDSSSSESSSLADEASSLDDDEDGRTPKGKKKVASPPKRGTPRNGKGKVGGKRQTQLRLGSSPRSAVVLDDGDEDGSSDDLPVATPRASRAARKNGKKTVALSDDEESDDVPIATPKLGKRPALVVDSDDDEEEEEEDDDLPVPSSRREPAKRTKRARSEDDEDDEDEDVVIQSTKRRRLARKDGGAVSSSPPPRSSPTKRAHRSEKDKRRELLRRRRAGEDITMEDLETSSEEESRGGLYDTDSDLAALEEFEDDEEGSPEPVAAKKNKKKRKKAQEPEKDGAVSDEDDEDVDKEMEDFIDTDDEGTLGVPGDLLGIPLEFTRHSRKPLKEHFRDVVEWLVRFKFEPNFDEKHNELYLLGWKRLDDEVSGLASSKFASSAWKPEFRRALNARPKFVTVELPRGDLDRLFSTCEACGRSGHPATWTVSFEGTAYHRKDNRDARFLEDVESDEEEEDDEDSSDEEDSFAARQQQTKKQRDEDGNELPPESRQWSVGSVCKSNAETAHTLIHWKHNLLEWVGDTLENDGFMSAQKIAARLKMKRKQVNQVVDDIIAKWERQRVIETLYREFKGVLDDARAKSTTGRRGGRWGRG